ncbi:MAG: Multifunctional protein [Candidatus Adlerbacteria bacterium]|nr:Multifunctional protein [Candidatus Adlerbacteria bacterium]
MSQGATRLVARGKTKQILQFVDEPDTCRVVSLDAITALDGKKRHVMPGKGKLSNRLAANTFELLKRRGIPVAFISQDGPDSFVAPYCRMVPLEIVVRWRAREKSSYRKRNPSTPPEQAFDRPVVELFLKTSGQKWRGVDIPCDDPLLVLNSDPGLLDAFLPNKPLAEQEPLLTIAIDDLELSDEQVVEIYKLAEKVGVALKEAWAHVEAELDDFKMEVGITRDKKILVADVIDNDSHRLTYRGEDVSKQGYRDDRDMALVTKNYVLVTRLSELFPQ